MDSQQFVNQSHKVGNAKKNKKDKGVVVDGNQKKMLEKMYGRVFDLQASQSRKKGMLPEITEEGELLL